MLHSGIIKAGCDRFLIDSGLSADKLIEGTEKSETPCTSVLREGRAAPMERASP
jgi:hypothetical protein